MFSSLPSVKGVKFEGNASLAHQVSFSYFFLPLLPSPPSVLSLSLLSFSFFLFLSHLFLACSLSSLQLSLILSRLSSSSHIITCLLEHNHLGSAGWWLETRTKAWSYWNARKNNALKPSRKISTLTGTRS
jgi:hypothetical protein